MYEVILNFIFLQEQLTTELKKANPNSVDFKYFIDFPKKGSVTLNSEGWSFLRHGLGFRFIRQNPSPHLIVDPHVYPFEYGIIDDWRIQQFLESSSSELYDKYKIKRNLEGLFNKGKLEKLTANQYKVSR
ncbi:hypothetical protein EDF81_4648 [Enterobacter sp. BIGb0383]|uniref:DUF6896 domain-containing protein n=1 Tax=unclassified Enterobacter TaxID=2608935 RepID=UPI000F483018|nr:MULTISPECIES: hypothetical protein [unclassified Enterobacter]ROP48906.1 hypothetical protein EDF81_4648 [Enterobacter sp. BIGb0383]ROS00502.1 hypothetical protein EC848_4636 [Enterobacter sp. BIGb0359]